MAIVSPRCHSISACFAYSVPRAGYKYNVVYRFVIDILFSGLFGFQGYLEKLRILGSQNFEIGKTDVDTIREGRQWWVIEKIVYERKPFKLICWVSLMQIFKFQSRILRLPH
jgi:hypothetical protein